MKWNLILVAVLLLSFSRANADPVDDFVESQRKQHSIPGMSLAILKNGEPVLMKGFGYANLEHNIPAKPETIYQSGSVGKQFTAAAALLLVEEGKIRLEDSVATYFPDSPPAWKNITVRHLLSHTSGIPDYGSKDVDFRKDYTEEELLKVLQKLPSDFPPGERWRYSNSGYMLLGFLIHKASGKFYGDYLSERVFQPAGMSTTRIITEEDIVPNRAAGYELVKKELKNQEWVAPSINTTADGSLYLSALDMAKWETALAGRQLMSEASYEQMWTPTKLNNGIPYSYGFGWSLSYQRGHRLIQHSGHWQGFSTAICRYPEFGLSVIVLMNRDSLNSLHIAHTIAGLMEPALQHPRFMKTLTATDAENQAAQFQETWKAIAAGSKTGSLAPGLQHVVSAEFVREGFEESLKEMKSVEYRGCDEVPGSANAALLGSQVSRFCYYAMNSADDVSYVTVAFTADNKIADIYADDDYR